MFIVAAFYVTYHYFDHRYSQLTDQALAYLEQKDYESAYALYTDANVSVDSLWGKHLSAYNNVCEQYLQAQLCTQARFYLEQGQLTNAVKYLSDVLQQYPENEQLRSLGEESVQQVIEYADSLAQTNPDTAVQYLERIQAVCSFSSLLSSRLSYWESFAEKETSSSGRTLSEEDLSSTRQKVIVTASGSTGELQLLTYRNGQWETDLKTTASLGSNGITRNKTEGDHMTPQGTFPILFAFSLDKQNTRLPFIQISKDSIWICDPKSDYYNTLQSVNNPLRDWSQKSSYENMYVKFSQKRSVACICFGFNGDGQTPNSATPNKGSALFLDGVGVNGNMNSGYGDIKISASSMITLLEQLDPAQNPVIVIRQSS